MLLARAADDRQRARVGDQTGGRVAFLLHTDDVAGDHARMTAAGVRFLEEPRHEVHGTVAVSTDPWGTTRDLLQPARVPAFTHASPRGGCAVQPP